MSNNKLKCFFAFSNDIENNKTYIDLLIATLESAKKKYNIRFILYICRKRN